MREFATWAVICILIGIVAVASLTDLTTSGGLLGQMGGNRSEMNFDVSWSNGTSQINVRNSGSITAISEDDREILQMTPNGYLVISDDGFMRGGNTLELRANAAGDIERKFLANGRETPYDPAGKAWLAQLMPDLLRHTTFAAEARVERILKAKGVAGVLDEISLIRNGYGKRRYFTVLFEKAKPAGQELAQALSQAGREISSDYELRELLSGIVKEAMSDASARNAYLEAARSINSDYEMATLLIAISQTQSLDETLRDPYFVALDTINSDYEHRRVLSALVGRVSDPAILSAMLKSLSSVNSDYEAAEFLVSFARAYKLEGALRTTYLDATRGISSDYELNRALAAAN